MRRAYRGEFSPGLEEALVLEVARAREADPLRSIDLLVGSNLLGLYLKRLLARRFGAIAAIRPLTFLDLARRKAEPLLLSSGLRPLPRYGEELLLAKAASELPADGYFDPVRAFSGFRESLLASIHDLKDAGWTPADMRAALERVRLSEESRRKLSQLLRIFERYEDLLRSAGLYDRSDLLVRAAALAERGSAVHGAELADGRARPWGAAVHGAGGPQGNADPPRDRCGAPGSAVPSSERHAARESVDPLREGRGVRGEAVPAPGGKTERARSAVQLSLFPEAGSQVPGLDPVGALGEATGMRGPDLAHPLSPPGRSEESLEGGFREVRDTGFFERERHRDLPWTRESPVREAGAEQSGTKSGEDFRSIFTEGVGNSSLLLVYGFYDLIELQWRLMLAESRLRETVLFVPAGGGPAFELTRPLCARLDREGFHFMDVSPRARVDDERRSGRASAPPSDTTRLLLEGPPSSGVAGELVRRVPLSAPELGCLPFPREERTPPAGSRPRSIGVQISVGSAFTAEAAGGAAPEEEAGWIPALRWEASSPGAVRSRGDMRPESLSRLLDRVFEEPQPIVDPVAPAARPNAPIGTEHASFHGGPGGEVRFLSVPGGGAREAAEVARQLIVWAGQGIPFGRMAILARLAEPYLTDVGRALDRAGIPFVLAAGRSFAATRAARTAALLLEVVSSDWSREAVVSFLSMADLKAGLRRVPHVGSDPRDSDRSSDVAPAEWDLVSAEAGIVKGREEWREGLQKEIGRAHAALKNLEERACAIPGGEEAGSTFGRRPLDPAFDADEMEASARRLEAARTLENAIEAMDAALDLWPDGGRWNQCAQGFIEALRSLLRPSPEREELEEVIEGLAPLDSIGPCPERETFAELLRRALETTVLKDRRYERDGVLVGEIEAVRGLSFRAVAMMGMAEKAFPIMGLEDPILLDRERDALSTVAGATGPAPLPQKGDRLPEERLLFRLAVASALERLFLSWSSASPEEDRTCLPSPFLWEAAEALGVAPRSDGGEAREHDATSFPRVPFLPLGPADPALAIDPAEWLLASASLRGRDDAGRGVEADGALRAQLASRHPFLEHALASERARWDERLLGPYDGLLSEKGAERAFERFLARSISPTRIEEYASCPLKAFFHRVLGLRARRDPVEVESIDPRDRGTLVHEILAAFLGRCAAEEGGRARLDPGQADALRARLHETAQEHFDRAGGRFPVGYPLLWEIERARILEWLDRWLEEQIQEASQSGLLPAALEWSFGNEAGRVPSLEVLLPGGGRVLFQGKVDRIDLDGDGRRARVIDYKTGSSLLSESNLGKRIADGRSVQLPVYMMAAARCAGEDAPHVEVLSAEYQYLADGKRVRLEGASWSTGQEDFTRALGTLIASARAGDYAADTRDEGFCSFCDYRAPCGEGRTRLFMRKRRDPRVASRLALREKPR